MSVVCVRSGSVRKACKESAVSLKGGGIVSDTGRFCIVPYVSPLQVPSCAQDGEHPTRRGNMGRER